MLSDLNHMAKDSDPGSPAMAAKQRAAGMITTKPDMAGRQIDQEEVIAYLSRGAAYGLPEAAVERL